MAIDVNFIIDNEHRLEGDEHIFHAVISVPPNRPKDDDSPEGKAWLEARVWSDEPVDVLPASATMLDALVKAGIFPSKSEARKNWKGPIEIPDGFSEWVVGKLKNRLSILKPIPVDNFPNS